MSLRDESRKSWVPRGEKTAEGEINLGSFQRIADSLEKLVTIHEKLAASYEALRSSRDYWETRAKEENAAARRLARRNAALRGVITRMRSKRDE